MNDVVNHPSHYTDGKYEVWDFIEDRQFGYLMGNVIKYISRAGKKDPNKEIEDLEKATVYLNKRMRQLHPFILIDTPEHAYDVFEETSSGYIYMDDYVKDKGIKGRLRDCMMHIDLYCKMNKTTSEKFYHLKDALDALRDHIAAVKDVTKKY